MKTNDLLANVRVASPCPARWGHMIGDDRSRFCAQCQKHVYNLSSMTADEATALILAKEGKLCARFYRRADGMVLTADCPVGASQVWTRLKRLAGAAAALAILGLSVPFAVGAAGRDDLPFARSSVIRAWNDAVFTVKTWLGLQPPPPMIMGVMCATPSKAPAPVPPPPPPQPTLGEVNIAPSNVSK